MMTTRSERRRNGGKPPWTRALATGVLVAMVGTGAGCTATRAYRDAQREESRQHWDLAVLGYEKATRLDPDNSRYRMGLLRARQRAAISHYQKGRVYRSSGQLDLALVELEQSVALDGANDSASQELRKVREDIEVRQAEAAGGSEIEKAKAKTKGKRAAPPMLNPSSDAEIQVSFQEQGIKKIYQSLAAAAGINIIFDPQLKDDKFSIDLRGMSFQKALETAMRQAGHFYKVLDEKTLIVAQDNNQNRKEYEDLVIRTFFLSNGDVKDVSAMVRSILDLRRLGTIPQLNAIVIRDTADKVAVAERIIDVNDKAKAEVLVDVELVQLNTSNTLEIGALLKDYLTVASLNVPTGSPGGTTGTASSLPWAQILTLGLQDFNFTIPSVTFNFVKNNSDAELLAKPQLRIAEGEKAQLTIGDRVPIPVTTVNTTQSIGSSGVVPVTSFQYQDVGIKIDIEPRVHHNKEVTMKLTVEVSEINGYAPAVSGQAAQPIIGTRTITSTIRLKEGETNILAGLISNSVKRARSSFPFLGDIPILGALFSNTKDEVGRKELLLTLTPHIIRAPQITEDDMAPIWVGTENNVSFSGLSSRLESPMATGSPFDGGPPAGVPPGPGGGLEERSARPVRQPPVQAVPFPQGAPPTDPFRQPKAEPRGEDVPKDRRNLGAERPGDQASLTPGSTVERADLAAAAVSPPEGPLLALTSARDAVGPGESTKVSLASLTSLEDLRSLEVTLEWDPTVVEVTGISPGPWASGSSSVRLQHEEVPGRLRLQLDTPAEMPGLPEGALATLDVRGIAAGVTVFRVSAGTAVVKPDGAANGASPARRVTPVAEVAALTVTR